MRTLQRGVATVNGDGLTLASGYGQRWRLGLLRTHAGELVARLTDQWGETAEAVQDGDGLHDCDCGACVTFLGCVHTRALESAGVFTEDPRARSWKFGGESIARCSVPAGLSDEGIEF